MASLTDPPGEIRIPFLRCEVYPGVFPEERALIFRLTHGQKASGSIHRWRLYDNRLIPIEIVDRQRDFALIRLPIPSTEYGWFVTVPTEEIEWHH